MSVLCPRVPPLTRYHCSHFLLHYCLRSLPRLPGSCSGNRTLSLGSRHLRSGSAAACPGSRGEAVSEALGWSRFHCCSLESLQPRARTWLLLTRTAQRVSGQRGLPWSYGCHLSPRNLVWSWQEERRLSWPQTQPNLWDHCWRRRNYCWWDWPK